MSLVEEYRRQFGWRDWEGALSLCPLVPGQAVLDLGCGSGDVSGLLAARGLSVTGVDGNEELVAAAREQYPACRFEQQDLRQLNLPPNSFDGMWCSFTAAYFTDFRETLARWCSLLKEQAWVCVIEMDDLLGHEPLSATTHERIAAFYAEARAAQRYDFRAGAALPLAIESAGFQSTAIELADQELAFDGPAIPEVLEAWRARLARMGGLRNFLGTEFPAFEDEFLKCLSARDHRSRCRVVCRVGIRRATTAALRATTQFKSTRS
jgi:ubiquinone/menaquinone biosynthesis C-methylase UbiE